MVNGHDIINGLDMKKASLDNMPIVCIVLLNFEGADDTVACLDSLLNISYQNYRIVIVDNASSDSSVDTISQYFSQINLDEFCFYASPVAAMQSDVTQCRYTLIQSQVNGGYGFGNNIGIRYALKSSDTDYLLILNNDTIVDSDFLEPMVTMCEQDETIGIASGKIYYHDRPDVIWFNGGRFYPCTAKLEHVNYKEKDVGQQPPIDNNFISGCMWLIPRRVIESVGFINEGYFMYVEDLEYCHRALIQGYRLEVCSKSIVWHKVGGSAGGDLSTFSVYWSARNKTKFIMQYSSKYCRFIGFFYLAFFNSLRWLRKKDAALVISHLKGMVDGCKQR